LTAIPFALAAAGSQAAAYGLTKRFVGLYPPRQLAGVLLALNCALVLPLTPTVGGAGQRRGLVHASMSSTHSGWSGPPCPPRFARHRLRLAAPGIHGRTTSMSANAVHRQRRPGRRRVMRRTSGRVH